MSCDVVPAPRFSALLSDESLCLPSSAPVLLGKAFADNAVRWAVRPLLARLRAKAAPLRKNTVLRESAVLIGDPKDHPELAKVDARLRRKIRALGGEGYLLSTGMDGVRLVAESPAGVFCGVHTLLQMLDGRALPRVEIADAPAFPFRGIHLPARHPERLPQLKRLIAEELPRQKANAFVMEIGYGYAFKSHPEIKAEKQFSRSQIRQLVRLARENNVKLIPLLNCYGHQSWRTERIGALLRAYPEFNETPDGSKIRYCANWCPSNPDVYAVVFDLLDELIDVFEADSIHLGMDEVFEFGQCPRCKGKTPAESFALAVNTLYDHVARKRGVKMLIWGDRLIDGKKTPYNKMNGARNQTHPARDMIPKDILLCDWHYHLHRSYPSIDQFEKAGFDYVICGWQKPRAVDALFAYAFRHGKRHLRGCLATNWHGGQAELDYLLDGVARDDRVRSAGECFRKSVRMAWSGPAR